MKVNTDKVDVALVLIGRSNSPCGARRTPGAMYSPQDGPSKGRFQ
ncbi:MAG: hypothetical protein ABSF92_07465 [Candidatus Acidiferrales bacterium]